MACIMWVLWNPDYKGPSGTSRRGSVSEFTQHLHIRELCLTYTLIWQTCLTAPVPGRISQQARRYTDCTIFSHPKSRHRPMQSSTLICLASVSFSLTHFLCPSSSSPLHLRHFPVSPTDSIHMCPRSPSCKSFLFYHCHAPHCFVLLHLSCVPLVKLFFPCVFV